MADTQQLGASEGSMVKRKRESSDSGGPDAQRLNRSSHGSNGSLPGADAQNFTHSALASYDHGLPNSASELNIDQQILQHVGTQNGITDENALTTAKAALAAHNPQNKYPPPPENAFDNNLAHGLTFGDDIGQNIGQNHNSTAAAVYAAREAQSMNQKPTVGSPEWHQVRKNNHKEGKC
jgi:bHLH factor